MASEAGRSRRIWRGNARRDYIVTTRTLTNSILFSKLTMIFKRTTKPPSLTCGKWIHKSATCPLVFMAALGAIRYCCGCGTLRCCGRRGYCGCCCLLCCGCCLLCCGCCLLCCGCCLLCCGCCLLCCGCCC